MDIGSLIGLLIAIGLPVGAVVIEGNPLGFFSAHATMIVFGGIIGITIFSFPLHRVFAIGRMLGKVFFHSPVNPLETIDLLKQCSERARRDGILALEHMAPQIRDEFLKKGIRMAVDGLEPHSIKETLTNDIASMEQRHSQGQFVFENLATNGPAFAMIGTLIGMVAMLQHMEDPSSIGPSMATALLATLYGAMVGYCVGFPIVNRLKERHAEEVLHKEIIIEGIMAIQAGDNPRVVEQRLLSFLPLGQQVIPE
ncbi:MAG: motility protein A [Candidatus Omnitrophica bacterium]|nr:Chemotaxis protein PomA [bacterium]NUN97092.1 motility protein A [Candidatus Omnitrophota bacterium]